MRLLFINFPLVKDVSYRCSLSHYIILKSLLTSLTLPSAIAIAQNKKSTDISALLLNILTEKTSLAYLDIPNIFEQKKPPHTNETAEPS